MVTAYLFFVDLSVPLVFGLINYFLYSDENISEYYFYLYLIFSLSIYVLSLAKDYYKNYFLIDFSEKIKISIITWLFAIFVQLVIYNYFLLKIDTFILLTWILIPIIILILKYLIKVNINHLKKYPIHIIGEFYKFNDHEIKMLMNKGFIVYFYNKKEDYLSQNIHTNESIIILNLSNSDVTELKEECFKSTSLKILQLEEFFEKYLRKVYISNKKNLFNINSYERSDYIIKRLIDLVSVIIFLPILFLLAVHMFVMKKIKKISDSTFYKQPRYGMRNKIFNIYKLRTMQEDSDTKGNTYKNDPRIYPFAKKIRNLRLDEIPQIINIFLGHMHLVGPRAEWVILSDEYNKKILNYNHRHIVRPGITGWAQIAYPYGVDSYDARQKLMYDLYYIKNWSIWLEIEICLKTFLVILDTRGF